MSDASLIAAGVTLVGVVLVFIQSARANRTNERKADAETQKAAADIRKAEADTHRATFEASFELAQYIDERVEAAVRPLREKLEAMETRYRTLTNKFLRVLRSVFLQWPSDRPAPHLHPRDTEGIEEVIPPEWLPQGGSPERP